MTRGILMVGAMLAGAGCASEAAKTTTTTSATTVQTTTVQTTERPASSSPPVSTARPTTTVTTTTMRATTTTETPTTSTIPPGSTINRASALAANQCLDAWNGLARSGRIGFYATDDLTAAQAACDEAGAQLDLDDVGAPPHARIFTLVLAVGGITVALANEKVRQFSRDCDTKYCTVPATERTTFLDTDELDVQVSAQTYDQVAPGLTVSN